MTTKALFNRKVQLAFSAALALLLVVGVLSYRSNGNQAGSEEWVAHTQEVLATLAEVLSSENEAISARQGYFITSESMFLRNYETSAAATFTKLARVRQLTADNAPQQRRLDSLEPLITRRLRLLGQLIHSQGKNPSDVVVQSRETLEGEEIQARVGDLLAEMAGTERILLQSRIADAGFAKRLAIFTILFGTSLALGLVGACFYLLQQKFTEQARVEEALLANEVKFRGILESAPDAMVITDAQSLIVLVNAETERLFGYRREELIGQPVDTLVPKRFRAAHPHQRHEYVAHPRTRSMASGLELCGLRKDGIEFPAEISLSPLETREGLFISSAVRDISRRKKAEEALRGSEIRLRMAIEAAEIGTWFWNIQQDEISWSEKFRMLFGLTSDAKLTYREILEVIHPDDRERVDRSVKNTVEQGVPYDIEYRIIWPDSSVHWIRAKGRAQRSPEGVAVSMQGIVMDITEHKEAQEVLKYNEARERRTAELKRSNDELQQFAYIAAHDLQEPLRMIFSYTQLLAQRYKGRLDSDADDFIAYAMDGVHRMQRLIEDLLAYCRVGTTGRELCKTSSEDAMNQALLNLRAAIQESGGVVTHDPLPTVIADSTQLVQLFQNVIGNAIKYRSAELPRVHVSAKRNGNDEWTFSTRDNGLGIDPKYFQKIFVMFQRLHGREEFSGTGIGLTVCKKIVERHGGRMWVDSEPGKGSTFYFTLPGRG
jgi:PAS domain S-box-containing protein